MKTVNKAVTTSWSQITTNTTGVCIFENISVDDLRYAWMPSTVAPTDIHGHLLRKGDVLSRGIETGHLYAKANRSAATAAFTE